MLDNIIQYLTCSNYRIVYYENTSNTIQTVLFSIKEIFYIRPFDGSGVHISINLKYFWKLFRSKHISDGYWQRDVKDKNGGMEKV